MSAATPPLRSYYVTVEQIEYRTLRIEAESEEAAWAWAESADSEARDEAEVHSEYGEQKIRSAWTWDRGAS